MAKMHEEIIVIKVSKLVRDTDEVSGIADAETLASLEVVVQELVGTGVLVEIASE
tara:strand:+ start:208 stop:372 length:165 start_codon:yes stop_codon:yes gene_type:complete